MRENKNNISIVKMMIIRIYINNHSIDIFFRDSIKLIHVLFDKKHIDYKQVKKLERFCSSLYRVEKKEQITCTKK